MFIKKLVGRKNDEVEFEVIPKTNEDYISVTFGFIRFIDSHRFLSMSLDGLVRNSNEEDFEMLKKESLDKWQYSNKNLAYRYEHFNKIDDFKKPVDNLKKENFFTKLKTKCPGNDEIERTKEIIKVIDIKNGEELTRIYLKSDVFLLANVF